MEPSKKEKFDSSDPNSKANVRIMADVVKHTILKCSHAISGLGILYVLFTCDSDPIFFFKNHNV